MSDGFYFGGQFDRPSPRLSLLPECGSCGLYRGCNSPKMGVYGQGRRGIMVIGEAPGETEDRKGRPFVGRSGELLRSALASCGVDLFRDCWVTNSVACRPRNNELPKKAVDYCRPKVLKAIEEHSPEVIVLVGLSSVRSVFAPIWKKDVGKMNRWGGWKIPLQKYNSWVCPVYHPSYVLRESERKGQFVQEVFRDSLKAAVSSRGRPWSKVPCYLSNVRVVHNSAEAAAIIHEHRKNCKLAAIDYETTTRKPDGPHARIVCCSVCFDGYTTIAFPWHGPVVESVRNLWKDPNVGKISSNAKFEERWTQKHLRVRGVNWVWDTMLAGHALDPRKRTTGVKFQALVRLGQEDYSSHIEPYLRSEGGNTPNRIHELNFDLLAQYCALDSLLEYEVCMRQAKEMGVSL